MLRIITDSASDFTKEELEKLNIDYISLNVSFDNTTYREEKDISKENFYKLLTTSEVFPRTSQPSPMELIDILEDAKAKGDDVLGIFLSSKVSGTYNSCVMFKNQVEIENCYFIDSLTGSAGLRILVNEAVKLRNENKSLNEIVEAIEELKKRVKFLIVADTLDYLAKGGRISALTGKLGNLLKFKPLLTVNDGVVEMISKPRGLKSAMEELIVKIVNDKIDNNYPIYGMYSIEKGNALKFIDKLMQTGIEIPLDHLYLVGAVIGSHLGPNGFGVAYISSNS